MHIVLCLVFCLTDRNTPYLLLNTVISEVSTEFSGNSNINAIGKLPYNYRKIKSNEN